MKSYVLPMCVSVGALLMTACASKTPTTQGTVISLPAVVVPPDFSNLSTKSCKNGEYIHTPAVLSLDKQGKVTAVSGIKVKDRQLAREISDEFMKAKYTPYRKNGTPIAHRLDVAISLKCPKKP